jgi:hypothetical protein
MSDQTKQTPTPKTPMTQERASEIHRTEALRNGGAVAKDSFAARALRAAANNAKKK